jgi:hypothetical protein
MAITARLSLGWISLNTPTMDITMLLKPRITLIRKDEAGLTQLWNLNLKSGGVPFPPSAYAHNQQPNYSQRLTEEAL